MTAVSEQTGAWLEQFTNLPAAPAWLQPLRENGFRRFAELGFPTTHNEEWRFQCRAHRTHRVRSRP